MTSTLPSTQLMVSADIHPDPFMEVRRVVEAACEHGVQLAGTGGVAVGLCCPSARSEPLARHYGDLDFVTTAKQVKQVTRLFAELGYEPDGEFNALNGDSRLFFLDRVHSREADVFVDAVRGCHELELKQRLSGPTLAPADLLLSKLQVRETNVKDYQDIFALLLDHEFTPDDSGISETRLADVCGNDWGWWRTVGEVSQGAASPAATMLGGHPGLERVQAGLRRVHELIESTPKSRKWKMRARLGDRVRWYESPEELAHNN